MQGERREPEVLRAPERGVAASRASSRRVSAGGHGRPRLGFAGAMFGGNAGYSVAQGETLASLFQSDGYSVQLCSRHPNRAVRLADTVATVARWPRHVDVVVVDTYSGKGFVMAEAAALAARRRGLPVVHVLHGGNLPEFARRHERRVGRLLGSAARLVAPSTYLAGAFAQRGFRVEVIPNVIDLDRYPFRPRQGAEPHLLWMRAFHKIYAPEIAVEAFRLLHEKRPEATLTMAGADKGGLAAVRSLVGGYGLEHAVSFPGFLDAEAKREQFEEHDVFLSTSRVDNTPVSVIEAGAFGVPVVSTDVGGVPHLVEDGRTALLAPPDDPAAIAAAVDRLVTDPALAAALSRQGRSAAERSSWRRVRTSWAQLFADVLSGVE